MQEAPEAGEAALRERIVCLEQELAGARERLRALQDIDQLNTDFALAVSHELRTPLTLISGYAQQLLLRWAATDEARRHAMVEKINVSSHRLSRLIDDMLLIANVEGGDLPIHVRGVALRDVVAEALGELGDRRTRGVPDVDVRGDDVWVRADGFRLEQVLISLLDNAVKHAPPGSAISLSWQREAGDVVIAVADGGAGMDSADLARLFTRFGRIGRTMGQTHGGTGLGLYIARRLTEAMNGRIWAESARGVGSTFFVALPSAEPPPDAVPGA